MADKKYSYVVSDGGQPLLIFYDMLEAFESGYLYIDVFDENGLSVESWKREGNHYTQDF
jgi:hypothetical protein